MNAKDLEQALAAVGAEIKKLAGRRIATLGPRKIFFTFDGETVAYCEARCYGVSAGGGQTFRWHEITTIRDAVIFLAEK